MFDKKYKKRHLMMKDGAKVAAMFAMILQLGIMMIVPIVACTLGGLWIGNRCHASWMAAVGFLIGALSGMRACAKIIKGLIKDMPYDATSQRALDEARKSNENGHEDQKSVHADK